MHPFVFISSVVTPATSYSLIDIATLKTLLGVTDTISDAFLALKIPQASTTAQNYCNNPFVVETVQDQVFPARDSWPWTISQRMAPLQLSRWPVISMTSVIETTGTTTETLVLGTDYLADLNLGQWTRLNQWGKPRPWGSEPITIQYSAGYATVPFDVVDAVADLIKGAWFAQTRDPMIRSQNVAGVYEAAYFFATGPGGEGDLPVNVKAKLDRYRVPVVG